MRPERGGFGYGGGPKFSLFCKIEMKCNGMKNRIYLSPFFRVYFTNSCWPKGSFSFLKVYHASSAKIPYNLRGGVKAML